MARTKLTRERIFKAADKLAAQGETPTLEAVRRIVGGSFTTLGPALRAWRERQAAESAAPAAGEAPGPLQEQLQEFLGRLWAAAAEQAERRTREERAALQRERTAMEESQRELADTADGLARRNEDLQERCGELEEETRRLRSDLQGAREGEVRARSAAEAQGRVADELRAQLAAARESFGTGLLERVEALERARETAPPAPRE